MINSGYDFIGGFEGNIREMQILNGMAYSDTIILDVLKRMIEENPDCVISQTQISEQAKVPLKTCQHSLKRLRKANKVKGELKVGVGYTYSIPR